MPPILTTSSTLMCPHGGSVMLMTSNTLLVIQGAPALLLTDQHTVAGCVFVVGIKPQPCVTVRWLVGATETNVNGVPVLLQNSVGLCFSAEQIPQGPPQVVQVQSVAQGT